METPASASSSEPILTWAGQNLGEPFEKLTAIARRLSNGESLSPAEALVRLPGTPFQADGRVLFPLLRDAMSLVAFEPADCCLLVLDAARQSILRAFHAKSRDNNYIDLAEIEVKESWSREALAILGSDSSGRLRTFLDRYLQDLLRRRVSWVLICDLRFLERLRQAAAAAGERPTFSDWLYHHYLALQAGQAEGSITATPVPNLLARLLEWSRVIRYRREHFKLKPVSSGKLRVVLWLRGAHYTAGFDLSGEAERPVTLPLELGESLRSVPFARLARAGARAARAEISLALNADLGLNLLYEILSRPTPLETHDSKIILEKAFELIRRFQDQWDIYPRPIPLQTAARLPARLFGWPYDIRHLAAWFLPGLVVDGARYLLGDSYAVGLYALEQGRLAGLTILRMRRNAMAGIESLPVSDYADLFAQAPDCPAAVREAMIELRNRIWERWGWVDYQVAYARELEQELLRLVRSGALFSVGKLLWQSPKLRRLGAILRQGGLTIYPDAMLKEGARWSGRQPLSQRLTFLRVLFDRGQQTRGLLYVRESVIGLLVLAGLAALLGWWLA
jgi:hypothetical protein